MNKQKIKDDFVYPEDLVVMMRRATTRLPHLRVVLYVKHARVYIDNEKNLYVPSKRIDREQEGIIIDLTLRKHPDSDVEPGFPVVTDKFGETNDMFWGIFSGSRQVGPTLI